MTVPTRLTEAEVAERLRLKVRGVARLRRLGRLPYLPGRPPTIAEADLLAYIEAETRRRGTHEKTPDEKQEDELAKIRARVRKNWLRRGSVL